MYSSIRQSSFRWRYRDIVIIVIVKCLYLFHFLFLSKKKKDTPLYKNVSTESFLDFLEICQIFVDIHRFHSITWFKKEIALACLHGNLVQTNIGQNFQKKYISVDTFLYQVFLSFFFLLKSQIWKRYRHYNHYISISSPKETLPDFKYPMLTILICFLES